MAGNDVGSRYLEGGEHEEFEHGIHGDAGNDTITAGDTAYMLHGGDGDDRIEAGDDADSINGDAGDYIIIVGHSASNVYAGDGADTIIVGANALNISAGSPTESTSGNPCNDILVSNHVDQIRVAHGGAGNNIIVGNVNTPSIELLSLQNILNFEILLRAVTDDVLHLDFTSHARLENYGITVNDPDAGDIVSLSDVWTFSAEKTTETVDVFTSIQNGITLELELLNEKSWDFNASVTASEKALGQPVALTLQQEGYYISQVLGQGKYGHLEEVDGSWYYVLDRVMDSGQVAGANAVANADAIIVEIKNQAGQTQEYTIPVTIIDDAPQITVTGNQEAMEFYEGADGAVMSVMVNDHPVNLPIFFENAHIALNGDYGILNLYFDETGESVDGGQPSLMHAARVEYQSTAAGSSGGTDVFIFKLTDGDGDVAENLVSFTSQAVVPDSPVASIDQLTFLEENLHNGTTPDYMPLVKNGALAYNLPSGLAELRIVHNGATYVIPENDYTNLVTDNGIFSIWQEAGAINYSFILTDPLHQSGESGTLEFEAILRDGDGQVYSGNDIFVHIINDSPRILQTKTWRVDSANPEVSGNASEYYMAGADGGVFKWLMTADLIAEIEKYGALSLDKDGAYSFILNQDAGSPDGTFALMYDFEDLDGDAITGYIYIDIA